MSWLDLGEAVDIFTSTAGKVADVAGKVADVKFSWQTRNLDQKLKTSQIMQANQQIKFNEAITTTQLEIAKAKAQGELKRAQDAAQNGYFDLLQNNMNAGFSNVSGNLNRQNSGSNIMLWLTVAGVAIAGMQLLKARA